MTAEWVKHEHHIIRYVPYPSPNCTAIIEFTFSVPEMQQPNFYAQLAALAAKMIEGTRGPQSAAQGQRN